MKKRKGSHTVVLAAFLANLFIAAVKFAVSALTRSSAMLAEAIHSSADTLNQVLLFVGMRKAERKADELHPFGFSGEGYFWPFIVAIILFTSGALFSVYEGVHKLRHPAPVERLPLAIVVLLAALLAEAASLRVALRSIRAERGAAGLLSFLHRTKKAELVVVFLEDTAALVGLGIALAALLAEHVTGILLFDGLASVLIGVLLAVTALLMGWETKSLLIGEGADPELLRRVRRLLLEEESVARVIHIRSLHLGADDILLAVKAEFDPRLSAAQICSLINGIESDLRRLHPEFKKIFIEPDIYRPA